MAAKLYSTATGISIEQRDGWQTEARARFHDLAVLKLKPSFYHGDEHRAHEKALQEVIEDLQQGLVELVQELQRPCTARPAKVKVLQKAEEAAKILARIPDDVAVHWQKEQR
jgi:hypothetical protein